MEPKPSEKSIWILERFVIWLWRNYLEMQFIVYGLKSEKWLAFVCPSKIFLTIKKIGINQFQYKVRLDAPLMRREFGFSILETVLSHTLNLLYFSYVFIFFLPLFALFVPTVSYSGHETEYPVGCLLSCIDYYLLCWMWPKCLADNNMRIKLKGRQLIQSHFTNEFDSDWMKNQNWMSQRNSLKRC